MSEKRKETLKSFMINLGIMLILTGSMVIKGDNVTFFFLGLVLLAARTFEFKGAGPRNVIMAEIMISGALSIAAVVQLVMARSFGSPQIFLVIILLGGILVVVESVRKYAELE